ncbi:MAG: hypothetical protein MHPSP_003490, partial [Paramarteilia canceri]
YPNLNLVFGELKKATDYSKFAVPDNAAQLRMNVIQNIQQHWIFYCFIAVICVTIHLFIAHISVFILGVVACVSIFLLNRYPPREIDLA